MSCGGYIHAFLRSNYVELCFWFFNLKVSKPSVIQNILQWLAFYFEVNIFLPVWCLMLQYLCHFSLLSIGHTFISWIPHTHAYIFAPSTTGDRIFIIAILINIFIDKETVHTWWVLTFCVLGVSNSIVSRMMQLRTWSLF